MRAMNVCRIKNRSKNAALGIALSMGWAGPAFAHASEQGFVLLLPTGFYILAGTTSVALTIFLVALLPQGMLRAIFRPRSLLLWHASPGWRIITSCLSFAVLIWLIWVGMTGSRDPLSNPLPLFIWTLWWIGFVALQGLIGDLWRWVNPWTGPVAVTRSVLGLRPFMRFPVLLGHSLAIVSFLGIIAFLLADAAPSDPARLAGFVGGYWLFSYLAVLAFGPRWLCRAEGVSVLMRAYAGMALFGRSGKCLALGLPGWQVLKRGVPAPGMAVFILLMLGSGSFDGLNETFWWLDLIGVNPLEFPGRSAVRVQNLTGLLIANLALITLFLLTLRLGLALIGSSMGLGRAFCLFAPSILPIALGYHIAHYLPSFLVDGQYALAAISDPLASGADLLGLGQFYVTTGFFNTQATVRVIWLTQAAAVISGHIGAVMLAHAIAVRHFGPGRRAALSQLPLALFMIFYTLFGLWLLASPRGA
jgi:hypothetical protein